MSGGGGGTTTQKADPWSGVQPYLANMYQRADATAKGPAPQYYPGSTVAQPGQYTWDTLNQMTDVGNNGTSASRLLNDNASAISQGQDQTSQDLRNAAMGNNQAGWTLGSVANGTDYGQQVLAQLAGGGGASGQAYQNMIAGNTPEMQAQQNVLNGNTTQDKALNGIISGSDAGSQYYNKLLSGSMLNGNPYLSEMVGNINKDTTRDFNNSILPGIASQLSAAGRYGSGAGNQAISDAGINLADRLNSNATNIYGNNYAAERQLQDAAAGKLQSGLLNATGQRSSNVNGAASFLGQDRLAGANGLNAQQYNAANARTGNAMGASQALNSNMTSNLNALSGRTLAGNQGLQQAYQNNLTNLGLRQSVSDYLGNLDQQNLTDQVNRWNFNQAQPWQQLQNENGILNGAMALNGSTTQAPGNSLGRSLLGGAAGGAAMGTAIMPGWGTAIGAGAGALMSVL